MLFFQRESLPVAIEKVKDRHFGFCACDNDGVQDFHWAPGKGGIPWQDVLATLKRIGYGGSIDLEINLAEAPDSTYIDARSYLERILGQI